MSGYDVEIETLPLCGFLNLQGGNEVRQLSGEYLGIELPTTANTLATAGANRVVYCINPDHWLLQAPDGSQLEILESLEQCNTQYSHSFVDVSDMYARIRLSGAEAREVLSQGVAIDIHPRVFGPGSTARIGFAKTTVQLCCIDTLPTYIIIVFTSYRQHVLDWLHQAAAK